VLDRQVLRHARRASNCTPSSRPRNRPRADPCRAMSRLDDALALLAHPQLEAAGEQRIIGPDAPGWQTSSVSVPQRSSQAATTWAGRSRRADARSARARRTRSPNRARAARFWAPATAPVGGPRAPAAADRAGHTATGKATAAGKPRQRRPQPGVARCSEAISSSAGPTLASGSGEGTAA
jgi:hypothetical protein